MRLNDVFLQEDVLESYIAKNLGGLLGQVVVDGRGSIFFDIDKQETPGKRLIAIVKWWKQVIIYSTNSLVDELDVQNFTEDDVAFAIALLLLILEEHVLAEEEYNFIMCWDQDSDFQRNFRKDGYTELVNFISDIKAIFNMIFLIADRSHISCLLDEKWLSIWRYLGLTIAPISIREERTHLFPIQGYDHDYYITWH